MELNYILIALAVIAQFIIGALWYSHLLFGKLWMQVMGGVDCTPEERKKIQKTMTPFYILQLLLTIITTAVLAFFIQYLDLVLSAYCVASLLWLGFVVPTQISGVIWANTPKNQWLKQISIMALCQLVTTIVATYILTL